MIDVLRTPWILPAVLETIKGGGDGAAAVLSSPKLAQLIEVMLGYAIP